MMLAEGSSLVVPANAPTLVNFVAMQWGSVVLEGSRVLRGRDPDGGGIDLADCEVIAVEGFAVPASEEASLPQLVVALDALFRVQFRVCPARFGYELTFLRPRS